jgi:hypothetical protein
VTDLVPLELSVREPASRLLDEPLVLRARGGAGEELVWRARYRDDDGRVWKAEAPSPEELAFAWRPAKPATGPLAALQSLRPLDLDVRVEAADGRAAGRRLGRKLLAEGVKARRWRDGLTATLYLPAEQSSPTALVLVSEDAATATLAAALLASRGVIALAVAGGDEGTAVERLTTIPSADGADVVADVVLPPNVGLREGDGEPARERAAAWDALLERAGARPRETP